ncbi:MAG: hypothetical protein S4CHLAM7_12130 [Chlamydiae bacterium]|nr:hypothetical protein [Chlamydiota bacterium]
MNQKKIHCITFAPFLKELNGHVRDYHQSLHQLFALNGWKTKTLVNDQCLITDLSEDWKKVLYFNPKWSRRQIFSKMFPILFNIRSFTKTVRSYYKALLTHIKPEKGSDTVLLLETFNTFHLYALAVILPFLPTKNIHLWILYRYDSKQLFFKGKRDKKVLKWIEKILCKKRLTLFADTNLLADELSNFFKRSVHLVPIPHTSGINASQNSYEQKSSYTLWWPGVPRRPKGLHSIQKITSLKAPINPQLTLRLSERTPGLPDKSPIKLERVSENLDRVDYLNFLKNSDAILLPYNMWNYRYSSSGIFIEAVCAQKIPIVSEGLWISEELKKHGLKSLIVNFEDTQILFKIVELIQDENVYNKLKLMSQAYQSFHNEQYFAKQLLQYL